MGTRHTREIQRQKEKMRYIGNSELKIIFGLKKGGRSFTGG